MDMREGKERTCQGPAGDSDMERRGKLGRAVSVMPSGSIPLWFCFLNLSSDEK